MDGAASVITVVSLALSSTKFLYDIVASIKQAPKCVSQIASYLRDLSSILQQLVGYSANLHLAADLPTLIERCAESLRAIEAKLGKLAPSNGTRAELMWKNVKALLQERQLEKMATWLQQHVAALSLQLSVLEGKAIVLQTERLQRLEVSTIQHVAVSTATSETVSRTKAGVDQIHEIAEDLRTTSQAWNHGTRKALDEMSERMQGLAGLTADQASKLSLILELLKQQVVDRSPQKGSESSLHRLTSPSDDSSTETMPPPNPNEDFLEVAIDRLCGFVDEKDKVLYSAEADSLIYDIEKLLIFLSEDTGGCKAVPITRKRGVPDDADNNDNKDLQYRRDHPTATNAYVKELGDFEASITLMPNVASMENARRRTQIAVFLQQRMLHEGSFLYRPLLSISALLPSNSEVFRLVSWGDVPGLVELLSSRDACLNDRDLMGRSLLNYSISYRQPKMCEYLIDQGADPDFVEPWLPAIDSSPTTHALALTVMDMGDIQCMELLLKAGADPTSLGDEASQSFSLMALRKGLTGALGLLLTYGLDFLDADCETPPNMFLYQLLQGRSWTSAGVALILDHQRLLKLPVQKLENCLNEALRGSSSEMHQGLKEVLILLIRAGADVYSGYPFENFGCCGMISFDCHQCLNDNDLVRANCPPAHRNIWIEALTACGYDADQVILNTLSSKRSPGRNDCGLQSPGNSSFSANDEFESFAAGEVSFIGDQFEPLGLSNDLEDGDLGDGDLEDGDFEDDDLEDDHTPAPVNNILFEQQDWSALEGDAAVWRT
ncbi:MAG: hypothetical protein Q9195_002988 [Heterodermia aff. obscurata]